jgi:hypothetical protein
VGIMYRDLLNPEKALIFRICHRDNIGKVLDEGCPCRSSANAGSYVEIGNQELIAKRNSRPVPCGPGGTLSDYVPFYFTPFTPMLYNIMTGYNGIAKKPIEDILIMVSSLHALKKKGVPFVFTDRHAYLRLAQFSDNLDDLSWIIWPTLQIKNFKKDDIEKFEKYQAEALIYKHLPLDALMGIACYNDSVRSDIQAMADARGQDLKIITQRKWYL